MTGLILKHFSLTDYKSLDTEGHFRGVLSTYGNEDLAGDVCDEGCWDESVRTKGGQFPLLWHHDTREPIGSFKVVDTTTALTIEGHFNQGVQRGREAYALLQAGDVRGLSVGFNMVDWAYVDGVRHITRADLWEGSFVTFPANTAAYAEAKAMAQKNGADLRKGMAALPAYKSLSEECQQRILRAIDEAISGETEEDEQKEDVPEDTPTDEEDPKGKEDEPGSEEEQEQMKAVRLELLKLKNSMQGFALTVKDVSANE